MNNTLREKLIREQIEFSAADTLCFITPQPAELAQIQREQWTPVINAVNAAGCDFKMSETLDVPSVAQRTRDFLENRLSALTDAELSAFCQVSGGCKSVALAVAVWSIAGGGSRFRSVRAGGNVSKPFLADGRRRDGGAGKQEKSGG